MATLLPPDGEVLSAIGAAIVRWGAAGRRSTAFPQPQPHPVGFGVYQAELSVGYHDRAEDCIILVPPKEVGSPAESPQTFQLTDAEGQIHHIPFHRVREVRKDSQRIWHRGEPYA